MKKIVNAGGSKKKQKSPPPPPNQSLISKFFFSATNPNSQLNVEHVSTFEENDDEVIVLHRRDKRRIVEDEEDVPDEVKLLAENLAPIEVTANVGKRYKYAHTSFYKVIKSFYSKPANKFVPIPRKISRNSHELLNIEYPNLKKSQAKMIITYCAAKCRCYINIKTENKITKQKSFRQNKNAKGNAKNIAKNNAKNDAKKQLKAAEENYFELMRMFKNEEIKDR